MLIERFRPEHLQSLILQPAQEWARPSFDDPSYAEQLAKFDSYSGFIDGRIVMCGGITRMWEGRGEAWALIARDVGPSGMHSIHYAVKRYLGAATLRRIEAACDASFLQAHRWLVLLGFKYEGKMEKYTPDGRDCLRFAMVR